MKLRAEHTYDASPDEVFEMLADPAFRARVSDAQNVHSHDITIERDGDGFTFVNDQVQRTDGLPAIARKIAGDSTRAIQREEWTDRAHATVEIEAPGAPTQMSGTITLSPRGAGTLQVTEFTIKVKVPLVGGKLEGLLAETVRSGMAVENEVGDAWLKGERA
jgi:hypothetical protein